MEARSASPRSRWPGGPLRRRASIWLSGWRLPS